MQKMAPKKVDRLITLGGGQTNNSRKAKRWTN